MKVLNGHTSPETAFYVDSYPYSFNLRCTIRYWIETKKGYGMRFASQTTNPKANTFINDVTGTTSFVWNKPKYGVYSSLVIMTQDPTSGYVSNDGLHISAHHEMIMNFRTKYLSQLSERDAQIFDVLEKVSRKIDPVSWAEYDAKLAQTA